jgi:hypothetical protein
MAKIVGFSFGCEPSRFDNGVGSGKMAWGSGDVIDDVRTKGKLECSRVGAETLKFAGRMGICVGISGRMEFKMDEQLEKSGRRG